MLFTSYGFIGLTAAVLVLYYTALKRYQWQLLLAASYARAENKRPSSGAGSVLKGT